MRIYFTELAICDTNDNWPDADISDESKPLSQVIAETVGDKADGKLTFWYKTDKTDISVGIHLKEDYLKITCTPRTAEGTFHILLDIDQKCDTSKTLETLVREHKKMIREQMYQVPSRELEGSALGGLGGFLLSTEKMLRSQLNG